MSRISALPHWYLVASTYRQHLLCNELHHSVALEQKSTLQLPFKLSLAYLGKTLSVVNKKCNCVIEKRSLNFQKRSQNCEIVFIDVLLIIGNINESEEGIFSLSAGEIVDVVEKVQRVETCYT